jgi:pyruvate formate lyase activating enzyme
VHEALFATSEGDRVRCGLCPNACLIAEGARGVCSARGVVGGSLKALTYGLISSMAVDPIEKKPVYHYRPGTSVFSVGSVGCSMRCGHCQNWRISRAEENAPTRMVTPEQLVALALDSGSAGLAFTYNEPVIWAEYVLDSARLARDAGLYTVMVTNGYVTEPALDAFAEVIDVWRTDIKGYYAETYRRLCHVGHSESVRAAAERARRVHGLHVECVTNVVPGINDSREELEAVAHWIADFLGTQVAWHVTRFFPYLDFADIDPTPLPTLEMAREIGEAAGLRHVHLGNVSVR